MAVCIIVPIFNAIVTLPGAVDSLLALVCPQDLPEPVLILVDNGSTDGSLEWLGKRADQADARGRIRVVTEDRPGPAAARNAGIRAALTLEPRPQWVALMDADCIAPPNWLLAHAAGMEAHPHWDAAGGPLRTTRFDNAIQEFIERQGIMDTQGFYEARTGKPPLVLTANMIIRREALERAGLFDEDLAVGEDADWCWRLQWAGGTLGYNENAAVEHRHRTTVGSFARMMRRYGEGSIRVHRKHRVRLGGLPWDWAGAARLLKAVAKCLALPFRRLTPYQKAEAPLEVVRYGAFLCGRWKAWLLG